MTIENRFSESVMIIIPIHKLIFKLRTEFYLVNFNS